MSIPSGNSPFFLARSHQGRQERMMWGYWSRLLKPKHATTYPLLSSSHHSSSAGKLRLLIGKDVDLEESGQRASNLFPPSQVDDIKPVFAVNKPPKGNARKRHDRFGGLRPGGRLPGHPGPLGRRRKPLRHLRLRQANRKGLEVRKGREILCLLTEEMGPKEMYPGSWQLLKTTTNEKDKVNHFPIRLLVAISSFLEVSTSLHFEGPLKGFALSIGPQQGCKMQKEKEWMNSFHANFGNSVLCTAHQLRSRRRIFLIKA